MISVQDLAYVRYQVPDLDRLETFLTDFGMQRAARVADTLYMRGFGAHPAIYIAELGPLSRPLGLGLQAQSRDDLERLAQSQGVSVVDNPAPGGGHMVTLTDPDGWRLDVLAGGTAAAIPTRAITPFNGASVRARLNEKIRQPVAPSHVMRCGHVSITVTDLRASLLFYTNVLGMKVTDTYYAGTPENVIVNFLRFGLGAQFTDHHSIALIQADAASFEHTAFEVLDLDDLWQGNRHLQQIGAYRHAWGIGRHNDGSQIFDYWRDPFGNKIEHWTDGDLVNESYVPTNSPFNPDSIAKTLAQWGPAMPADFLA